MGLRSGSRRGEQFGLPTRIAATESVRCAGRGKADGVSGTGISDSRLRPNSLDKLARICRNSPDMKTRIPPILITFALVYFALLPIAQAVVPPPDGGYPGFNTAEGQNALFSLTTGSANAAVGWFSLGALLAAASTPLPAQGRSFSTPQTQIRHLARRRFYPTPPASTTPPLELPRF